ncbi:MULTISPECIES: hypothetical protein [spotted fever group]|uniref:Uncharacterized protein n=2 Tax=spotted fever group TaxID=114277 RepID=Q7PA35_RICS2|nr:MULTISPECIES: hypothetical protein [spotted fever group]AFC75440.1 hypothetical protein MC1_07140 [Rickettsia parkeri str. Portsmouth]EAA26002.1 hypothetical protein rsib_orf800 [Rickettsia sibirica 246]KJV93715.1 hypothetical protein RPAGB_0248 [Rickettsia parkeri str. Grand Bay]KJV95506.1 hypothetical protein RPAAT24_0708 [Rickettsia parkeri str. AT\
MEQLNKKLAKASDPKEKINLEKAITTLEENAKSNPMTLKKAGINQDDAEIYYIKRALIKSLVIH